MLTVIKDIAPIWPILISLLVLISMAVTVLTSKIVNRRLFKTDGSLIYVTVDKCEKYKDGCHTEICDKLDKLQSHMETMDAKRDVARVAMGRELADLGREVSKLSGKFEQYEKKNGYH